MEAEDLLGLPPRYITIYSVLSVQYTLRMVAVIEVLLDLEHDEDDEEEDDDEEADLYGNAYEVSRDDYYKVLDEKLIGIGDVNLIDDKHKGAGCVDEAKAVKPIENKHEGICQIEDKHEGISEIEDKNERIREFEDRGDEIDEIEDSRDGIDGDMGK